MPSCQRTGSLLYSRVETVLASEIAGGDLRVGDQLPTEDRLIVDSGQPHTVRRAIQNLVSRGLVEIRRAKHIRFCAQDHAEPCRASGFVEDITHLAASRLRRA